MRGIGKMGSIAERGGALFSAGICVTRLGFGRTSVASAPLGATIRLCGLEWCAGGT